MVVNVINVKNVDMKFAFVFAGIAGLGFVYYFPKVFTTLRDWEYAFFFSKMSNFEMLSVIKIPKSKFRRT